jgi:hypothetical protein
MPVSAAKKQEAVDAVVLYAHSLHVFGKATADKIDDMYVAEPTLSEEMKQDCFLLRRVLEAMLQLTGRITGQ